MKKPKRKKTAPKRKSPRQRAPHWSELPEDELFDLRLCDLDVKIEGTPLEGHIEKLHTELAQRGIGLRPHCWISDDWFSPDGVPGIAIPFYLTHPRLIRLERKQMLEVEGGTNQSCMRILRHEAGHAVDTAYRLHRRRQWRDVFGRFSEPYPEYYHPKPYSKSYVLHLDDWYAQSHPAEDFAETFAVWLKPRSPWRAKYRGWPALKKLQYVDDVVDKLQGNKQLVRSRRKVDPIRRIRKTLREHYNDKRARYGVDLPSFYDHKLLKLFSDSPKHQGRPTAASFLRQNRIEIRRVVAKWSGQYIYLIDQVLCEMIDRSRDLNLRLDRSERVARRDTLAMVTVVIMDSVHRGHHRIFL